MDITEIKLGKNQNINAQAEIVRGSVNGYTKEEIEEIKLLKASCEFVIETINKNLGRGD